MLSDTVTTARSYFIDDVFTCYPGASDAQVAAAATVVGELPPSLRAFLLETNGLLAIEYRVFGIAQAETPGDLVAATQRWRQITGEERLIAVAEDDFGNAFVLLPEYAPAQGEPPVAFIDHEGGETVLVASSFERFLWFALDEMRRRYAPDGRDRGKGCGWPFGKKAWVLKQDPALKALLAPPKPSQAAWPQPDPPRLVARVEAPPPLYGVRWAAGGRLLVGQNETQVLIWTPDGALRQTVEVGGSSTGFEVAPNLQRLIRTESHLSLSKNSHGVLQWWELATATCVAEEKFAHHGIYYAAQAFSADQAWLAVGCSSTPEDEAHHSEIRLYPGDGTTPVRVMPLAAHYTVNALAFSPDTRLLAVAATRYIYEDYHGLLVPRAHETEVTLWDHQTGECLCTRPTKSYNLDRVVFSADGRVLCALGTRNNSVNEVTVWAMPDMKPLMQSRMKPLVKSNAIKDYTTAVAVSADAAWIVGGYAVREDTRPLVTELICWDLASKGKQVLELSLTAGKLADLAFLDTRTLGIVMLDTQRILGEHGPPTTAYHIYTAQLP